MGERFVMVEEGEGEVGGARPRESDGDSLPVGEEETLLLLLLL